MRFQKTILKPCNKKIEKGIIQDGKNWDLREGSPFHKAQIRAGQENILDKITYFTLQFCKYLI